MSPSSTSRIIAGFLVLLWSNDRLYAYGCYPSIISFGDSIADTGNLKQLASRSDDLEFECVPPYGQDFIGRSTGRCSNGRLIIDFLAESLGLPLIRPYFSINNGGGSEVALRHGVNYAVVGCTATDPSFIEAKWNISNLPNISLGAQLSWFKQSLPSICGDATSSGCKNFIGRSLILMGEIGGNDYNVPISQGKHIDEIQSYVPLVIDTIALAINELIEMGARTLVVPGNFPNGCNPSSLTRVMHDKEEHDPITGCYTKLNEFSEYHNKLLQTRLNEIRELNPNVTVIYADYYNATMQIYRSPGEYGFTNVLKACCGRGGPFNYNAATRCGDISAVVCDDPDTYVSWDGLHYTEAAYKVIFKNLFQGPYTTPEFNLLCHTSSRAVFGLSSSM